MSELKLEKKQDGVWLVVRGNRYHTAINIDTNSPMAKLVIEEAIESQTSAIAENAKLRESLENIIKLCEPVRGDLVYCLDNMDDVRKIAEGAMK